MILVCDPFPVTTIAFTVMREVLFFTGTQGKPSLLCHTGNGFLGCILQVHRWRNGESTVFEDGLSLLDISA